MLYLGDKVLTILVDLTFRILGVPWGRPHLIMELRPDILKLLVVGLFEVALHHIDELRIVSLGSPAVPHHENAIVDQGIRNLLEINLEASKTEPSGTRPGPRPTRDP